MICQVQVRYAPVLIQTPDNITVLCSKGSRTPSKHGAKLAVHVDSALPEAMGMVRHSELTAPNFSTGNTLGSH